MNPLTVIRDSLYFFQRNLRQIALLCLPLVVLESLLRQLLANAVGEQASPAYDLLAGLLVYPLYTAALILLLDARTRGETPANRDLLARAVQLWPRLALLSAMNTLALVLGLSLYFIPGIWLTVVLAFAEYLLVLRGVEPLKAMKQSFVMSQGHFWRILLCILAVMGPLWLLQFVTKGIYPERSNLFFSVTLDSAHSFLQLFTSVVLFRLYMLISEKTYKI